MAGRQPLVTTARAASGGRVAVLVGFAVLAASCTGPAGNSSSVPPTAEASVPGRLYPVLGVADGDTITVDIEGTRERIRLIGIDAPEVGGTPECFGDEASVYAKGMLSGAAVGLVPDPTQDDRDRYGRLLRYVVLADGTDFGAQLLQLGYAHEYTYDNPYQRQATYRTAESTAHSADRGLWSPDTCVAPPAASRPPSAGAPPSAGDTTAPGCYIKGNINSKGEKIYHQPGESSYPDTVITESKGERYFCSVADAVAAGWRAAKN
jgi:micrococcal nuclease